MPNSTEGHLSIRRARAADARELARLAGELRYPTEADEMLQRLEVIGARSDHAVFVAERRDHGSEASIRGWVHVARGMWLESGESAEILGLVVDRGVRRGGVGRRLVTAAEEWSRALGLTRIIVRSNVVREEAHRFYPALDYALAKSQHVYIKQLG